MKYGLSKFLHAPLNADGTYGTVGVLAGAIGYKETLNFNNYRNYEDNALKWEDNSFKDGGINLTVGHDEGAIFAGILGRATKTLTGGKVVYVGSINDISKPQGFGFIETVKLSDNTSKFRVKFYLSVTFRPTASEGKTDDRSGTYSAPSIDGNIAAVGTDYVFMNDYDTLAEAVTVLYACFGKSVPETESNADLAALTIGDLALSPTFNAGITSYVAATTDATNVITAAPSDAAATVVIKNGSTTVVNEAAATWVAGANTVTVTVTKGTTVKVYTVVVTKS